jgi:hypothetical protein
MTSTIAEPGTDSDRVTACAFIRYLKDKKDRKIAPAPFFTMNQRRDPRLLIELPSWLGSIKSARRMLTMIKRRRLPAGDTREARIADSKAYIGAVRANNEARMARGLGVFAAYKQDCL